MFGGPPGGLKAPALPASPEPERKELPSLFGGPSKLAPRPAAAPASEPPRRDRSKSQTEPAPIVGKPFGPPGAAIVPTVIAEPEPTPSSRSFASAPEAKTMAMIDGGFVAGALAEIRANEARAAANPAVSTEDSDGPTTLDLGAMPQHRTAIDPSHQPTSPAMDAVAPPRPTPPPAPSSVYPTTYPPPPSSPYLSPSTPPSHYPGHPPPADQPTYRAPAADPSSVTYQPGGPQLQGNQPYPSGELLVPPHGTPPGTYSSQADMLPVHLIGFPQASYPRQQGWPEWTGGQPLRRRLPPWVLPVVFTLAIAVATGITIAIARAVG
jgi:hypothetical protein